MVEKRKRVRARRGDREPGGGFKKLPRWVRFTKLFELFSQVVALVNAHDRRTFQMSIFKAQETASA